MNLLLLTRCHHGNYTVYTIYNIHCTGYHHGNYTVYTVIIVKKRSSLMNLLLLLIPYLLF